ncbi:hypothetical protein FHR38_004440 [Micromonospora polyrhachis]|uniref:Uncharacterized protein n=1 Tax=Micromonospora polyrhachis TaxID=1282883 RepID=A0A7W7WRM0_9ACTN|nr:hypothetical protein [Micromonospora polyrhachis]
MRRGRVPMRYAAPRLRGHATKRRDDQDRNFLNAAFSVPSSGDAYDLSVVLL